MAIQVTKPLFAQAQGALFLCRPEISEADYIRKHGKEMHGAVLQARHLVRRPNDPLEKDLGRAAREAKIPHIHDPGTDVLAWHRGDGDKRFGRAAEMPCAKLVDLPLGPSKLLGSDPSLEEFVRATLSTQLSVSHPAPPYFRFAAIDDRWIELNIKAAATAQRLSGPRQMAIFVYATLRALESGAMAAAAARYREALPDRAIALLSVGGLDSNHSEPETLAMYLGAVDAFRAEGFTVIADRVGRFGAASVAAGASGYCAGTRVYRHAPASPESDEVKRRGALMQYEAPGRGDRIYRRDVARRLERGSIPRCPIPGCPVGTDKSVTVKDLRRHSIHLQQLEVGQAQELGLAAWAKLLAASPRNYVRCWAEALQFAAQARKAA